MRLTEQQRATLKEETAAAFGPLAQLRLFSSRVDDNAKESTRPAQGSTRRWLQTRAERWQGRAPEVHA